LAKFARAAINDGQGDVGKANEPVTVGTAADGDGWPMMASDTKSKEPRHLISLLDRMRLTCSSER